LKAALSSAILEEKEGIGSMSTSIEVVYEQGVLRPLKPLDLAEGSKVEIVLVEPVAAKLGAVRKAMSDPLFLADLKEIGEDFKHVDAEG
jgi:predicted DNA-binding antitoxin AbrB/MazE fold protein